MPDTLVSRESSSIPPTHASGSVNGHRANPKATKAKRSRDANGRSAGDGCEALELWRQFKGAEKTLNARIDEDNDTPEIAYYDAQDRFVDCKVTSLQDVLLKLLLLDETEDLEHHLKESPRLLWPRIVKSLLRDLKTGDDTAPRCAKDKPPAAACAPTDAIAEGVADAATADRNSALEDIGTRMTHVLMAAYDAQNLASLLDTVHGDGFQEASRRGDYWQKRWWEQAAYIGRTLERLGEELETNGEAIEVALGDLKHGRAPR
jgi:hypothetical protein